MKRKSEAGFSLVEVLVSMVILGLTIVPMMSGMVVALKSIGMADEMMHAQLAVSSAVEKLMAEGISDTTDPDLPGVDVSWEIAKDASGNDLPYYNVTVTSETAKAVEVKTVIRKAGGSE